MTILDDYAARVENTIDSTNLLGRLFWYALSEVAVPHTDFTQMLIDAGIEAGHPNHPRDVDVFKRVTTSIKHNRIPTKDPDIFETFRMVEFRDEATLTKRVVRERVNHAGRKLGFTELFDAVYDRETSDLVFKTLGTFKFRDNTIPTAIREQILDDYYQWRGKLNSYAIREWMRRYIMDDLRATRVRPGGGVYFLREAHQETLEKLETIGTQLQGYTLGEEKQVEFHTLPLVDDRKQREMVQRAFEAETIDAVDTLITEIVGYSKKKITADKYASLLTQYQDLTARTLEYEELLEEKLASTSTRLDIFQQTLLNLRKQVKD